MRVGLQARGSEGDISPFTALAAALVGKGHNVMLVVTDNLGQDYELLARRNGYRLIDQGTPIRQSELVMRYGFDPLEVAMSLAAKDLCASNDVVVRHFFVYPSEWLRSWLGISMATVTIVHNCVPSAQISHPGRTESWALVLQSPIGVVQTMVNRVFLPRDLSGSPTAHVSREWLSYCR